jgi:hypothetical protein
MKFYRWTQNEISQNPNPDLKGYLEIIIDDIDKWKLMSGDYWQDSLCDLQAFSEGELLDFPFTNNDLHVYSAKLVDLMLGLGVTQIQYIPLKIINRWNDQEILDYSIANYLQVIDCLDRVRSKYKVWTKENLLFWEKRSYMLGTFQGVSEVVLNKDHIGDSKLFRLWGWNCMVVVREEIKTSIEKAGITGCLFSELEVI